MIYLALLLGLLLGVGGTFLLIRALGLHVCPEDPEHPPRAFRVDPLEDGLDDDLRGEF